MQITEEMFSKFGLYVVLPAFIIFLFFIIWDVTKKSEANLFGKVMIFVVLGGAMAIFAIKELVIHLIEKGQ